VESSAIASAAEMTLLIFMDFLPRPWPADGN
jgi:hypothetical protein